MSESQNLLHFSTEGDAPLSVGSVSAVDVPHYALYGQPRPESRWHVNVEPLATRCRDHGWVIEPHLHPSFSQIVLVTRGGGEMSCEGEVMRFDAPSALIIPPSRIHGFAYRQETEGWVITIDTHFLVDLLARTPELRRLLDQPARLALDPAIGRRNVAKVAELRNELAHGAVGHLIAAEIALLGILLNLLRGAPRSPPAPSGELGRRAQIVRRYRTLVEQHYRRQPDLSEFAAEIGITVSQLRHACRETLGLSPLEVLHERIIGEARRCLAYSAMSVAEVGFAVGFEDAAYFTRFFTRLAGQSPSAFRRGYRRLPD